MATPAAASMTVTPSSTMPDPTSEPIATVTIQSKLFICEVARLPDSLTSKTIVR